MEIYYLVILLLLFLSFIETKATEGARRKFIEKIYWIPVCLIIFLIGFRWEMGTDWEPYFEVFQMSSLPGFSPMEKGYMLINKFFRFISIDYQVFILFHAIFTYLILFKFFKHFTPYVAFALLWYFTTNLGIVGSNRQLLAVAICTLAILIYIKNNNKIYFLLFTFCAVSIHNSAIFMLVYIFLDRYFSTKIIISLLILSVFIGLINISGLVVSNIGFLGQIAEEKASIYSAEVSAYSVTAILKRLFILLPMLIFYRNEIDKNINSNLVINGYFFGICVYLIFGQSLNIIATRGAMYFNLMEPILITYYIYISKGLIRKHLLILLFTFLSIILMRLSIKQYPEIFVPYKNKFFSTDLIKY